MRASLHSRVASVDFALTTRHSRLVDVVWNTGLMVALARSTASALAWTPGSTGSRTGSAASSYGSTSTFIPRTDVAPAIVGACRASMQWPAVATVFYAWRRRG